MKNLYHALLLVFSVLIIQACNPSATFFEKNNISAQNQISNEGNIGGKVFMGQSKDDLIATGAVFQGETSSGNSIYHYGSDGGIHVFVCPSSEKVWAANLENTANHPSNKSYISWLGIGMTSKESEIQGAGLSKQEEDTQTRYVYSKGNVRIDFAFFDGMIGRIAIQNSGVCN